VSDRYWVGGTANWDGTAGTKWATTSGGVGGASVPTSADDVFFTNLSTGTCTIAAGNTGAKSINCTGFTGTLTGSASITVSGSITLSAAMTFTPAQFVVIADATITCAGKTFANFTISGSGITVQLADAMLSSGNIIVTQGTFTTNNFSVTATQSLTSDNSNIRTINLGSSTVALAGTSGVNFGTSTNLTFNAGTSQINLSSTVASLIGSGQTFYNVSFTNTSASTIDIEGNNTFNNLNVVGRTSVGVTFFELYGNQTISGTLTLSAGTNATMRTFVRSNTIGTTRTLTCNAVASLTDIDFRDITIAGSAAPVSGTRLGDCKGNSGITFDAGKTVYYRNAVAGNWGSSNWSFTNGGTADVTAFPLAQDTAVFPSSPTPYPSSTLSATLNASYNIGTIDMSARTTNTMTLAVGSQTPPIYGNWINGTGTTLTGTGTLTFAGRGSQTITSAGKTFTQSFTIDSPSGSVTLQDAFVSNRANAAALSINRGTFDANGYSVSITNIGGGIDSSSGFTRTVAFGSGTWTIAGTNFDFNPSTNLTVTGTGTISLTSASARNFQGGGIQTYPTLNQGGTGTLTVIGSNKFIGLTNTAIGRIQFTGGTTNEFTNTFDIDGVSGNLLQLGSSNLVQAVLIKPTAWLMGANSTNAGNNTGLSFTGGGDLDYLSVSYINGQVSAPAASNSNFFLMFA
jgi:fibronectin-binding autotransporter adhesin